MDRQIFLEICSVLALDGREVAIDPPAVPPEADGLLRTADIDALVQQVRSLNRLQEADTGSA